MNDSSAGILAFVMLILGLWLGLVIGGSGATSDLRAEAIKAGVAEYYLDANHERQFRWKGQAK